MVEKSVALRKNNRAKLVFKCLREDPFQVTEEDILDAAPDYLIIDENLTDDDDDIQ